ncbi:MAG: asparagine synthase (glutamine-hydrolyzing) [Phycisphaeraceae bacterium]|nr:asparagine synthase (glutamine-hydrolyzing) [Phycisphaeraceae bacterium]
MCGIAGILRVHPAGTPVPAPEVAIPETWLDILDESIKHRGPDGQGRFRDRSVRADGTVVDVALVHRRLSIIDHAGGAQPMVLGGLPLRGGSGATSLRGGVWLGATWGCSPAAERQATQEPDGSSRIAVVFNGCIYNHRELRKELQAAGHRFETDHSDTEVLVHGWRQWGPRLIDRLDGMYSFAVWDSARTELAVFRDGFGEKPLNVLYEGQELQSPALAFSSTTSGLLKLRGAAGLHVLPASEHLAVLRGWIKYGFSQEGASPNISPLYTGSCRLLVQDELHRRDPRVEPESTTAGWWGVALQGRNVEWTADDVESTLRSAVRSRLDSDVPMGVFLSGGLDSSLVASLAFREGRELDAFTVRMPELRMDESDCASAIARHIGIRHHIVDCEARPADELPWLVEQAGVPFGDSSLLPSFWVSREARRHVKVVLGGDGGDEMFLGYERHQAIRPLGWLARLPRSLRRRAASAMWPNASSRSLRTKMSRLLNASAASGYKELTAVFPAPFDWMLGLRSASHHAIDAQSDLHHFGMTMSDEMTALRFDLMFYLPDDLMRKVDTASMAVALELRSPLLAACLARKAMQATVGSLMPGGQRKGLLRAVARKYLPAEIVDRPKQGFAIPIGEWFRTDYGGMKQLLMDHLNSAEPWGPPSLGIDLNMKFVRQMLDEHMGTGPSGRIVRDHSQRLYMLLVLSIWAKWVGRL